MTELEKFAEDAKRELTEYIECLSDTALAKLSGELSPDYELRFAEVPYTKGWQDGFKRCLSHIKQTVAKIEKDEAKDA